MFFRLVLHSVIRTSHVVKRACPHCVACLLLFAAVFVCFSVVMLTLVHSSACSAGAQTQFIHARYAHEVARHRTPMSASIRGVNNCAPLLQMSALAFQVRTNYAFSFAYSASTKASLIILKIHFPTRPPQVRTPQA